MVLPDALPELLSVLAGLGELVAERVPEPEEDLESVPWAVLLADALPGGADSRTSTALGVCDAEPLGVCDAEPLDVCEAEPLPVCEAEPLDVCDAEPLPVCDAELLPVCEAEPLDVCDAEPLPVCEAEPLPVCDAEPLPVCDPLGVSDRASGSPIGCVATASAK